MPKSYEDVLSAWKKKVSPDATAEMDELVFPLDEPPDDEDQIVSELGELKVMPIVAKKICTEKSPETVGRPEERVATHWMKPR